MTDEVLVNVLGNGGILYIAVQIVKVVVTIIRSQFPAFQPKQNFMAWVTLVLGLLFYGGISAAAIQGMEVKTVVDFLQQGGNLLLSFVQVVAGAVLYYQSFKRLNVPGLGYSLSGN